MSTGTLTTLIALACTGPSLSRALQRRRVRARLPQASHRAKGWAPAKLVAALDRADLDLDPDDAAAIWAGALSVGAVAGILFGQLGVVMLFAAALGPAVLLGVLGGRREARRRNEAPLFADGVASAARAGASLPSALRAAAGAISGPLRTEADEACDQIDLGRPVKASFARWAIDADDDLRLLGRVLGLLAEQGGRAGQALESTAEVLRARADLRRERDGLATQARASAMVMTAAPLVFALVAGLADPKTLEFLLATPAGLACLVSGVALDAAGARWMSGIVARPR